MSSWTLRLARSSLVFAWCAAAVPAQDDGAATDSGFRVGLGLLQRGLHAEAAKEFEAFVKASPRHASAAEAWYRLGVCHGQLQRPTDAALAFARALERGGEAFPLRVEARYRAGLVLRELKRPLDAAASLEAAATEGGPKHELTTPARFAAGEAWREAARPEAAVIAFLAAAAGDATPEGAYAVPALYAAGFFALEAGDAPTAAQRFGAAAVRNPKHAAAAECRFLAGEALLRAGDAQTALPILERAAGEAGAFADDADYARCRALSALGRGEAAAAGFAAFATRHAGSPLVPRARLEAARGTLGAGRFDAAAQAATALLAEKGEGALTDDLRPSAHEVAGLALLDAGRSEEALAHLEAAQRGGGDAARRARLKQALGDARSDLGRFDEALVDYRAARSSEDRGLAGEAAYGESLALHRLGRCEESLGVLRKSPSAETGHRLAVETRFAEGENLFALKRYPEAETAFAAVPSAHALGRKAAFKHAWCAYLKPEAAEAARRFAALVPADGAADDVAEESLAMSAVAALAAGDEAGALAAADRYRARYAKGAQLPQTERVASRVLRRRGDLRGAADRLAAAVAADGGRGREDPADGLVVAELAFKQGDFAAAAARYAALADRTDAVGAAAIEGWAWCAFELGEDDACRKRIARGLKHPAGEAAAPNLRELLVALLQRQNRHEEAVRAADDFLARHAAHVRAPEVAYARGIALARAGKFAEARDAFRALGGGAGLAAKERLPYELAWALKKTGDDAGAAEAFAAVAATAADPELKGECLLQVGARAAAVKRPDDARAAYVQVTGTRRPEALYRLGFLELEAGRTAEAAALFEELAKLDGATLAAEGAYLAGDCRARLGEWAAAASSLRRVAAEGAPADRLHAARGLLGRAEVELGRPAEAVAPLTAYLQADDGREKAETARAWLALGRARAALKDAKNAEAAFRKAEGLSDGPVGAEARYRIGSARQEAGDADGAVEAWLRLSILQADPTWVPRGLAAAADAFDARGDADKARKLRREIVDRFSDSAEAKSARQKLNGSGG